MIAHISCNAARKSSNFNFLAIFGHLVAIWMLENGITTATVSIATCVEARTVKAKLLPIDCFASVSSVVTDFPPQLTVVTLKSCFFTFSSKSASVTFLRASACSMDSILCSNLLVLSCTLSSCLLRLAVSRLDSIAM